MKKYGKEFCSRGLMWGAWGGPVILAMVWICLKKAGVVTMLTVDEVVLGIFSTAIMGFFAAGVSVVCQIESIPKMFAGLIQGVVLYLDYFGFYLLNGWIALNEAWIFSIIFICGFVVIWLAIYIPIRIKVDRMNRKLNHP